MSIDIDWSLLTPSSLSTNLVDLLNTHLASASRPSFIGPITVTSFDFGTEAPDVEIKDIRDVWRAFDEGDEEGDDELALATSTSPPRLRKMDGSNGGMSEYDVVDRGEGNDDLDDMASIYSGIGSPRSVVAVGIGLNSGILRDHHTILPFSTSILGRQKGSRPGSVFSMPMNNNSNNNNNYPKHTNDIPLDSPPPSPPVKPINTPDSKSTIPSLQLHFKISYMSNLHITLLTSLNVNYPSDNFMSLPLKLSITGMTLGGDVVVAYSGDKHRIHLCLIDDDEINQNQNLPIGQKILPSLSMESEIGHSDAHVLKNVGKVERFIADVVRKTLVEELVFPNFLTLAL